MNAPRKPADPPATQPGKRPIRADVGGPAAPPDDAEEEWRHEPVAPVDEANPLRSLGKAVGETVTGSDADTPTPPRRKG